MEKMGVNVTLTSGYQPLSNSQVEQANQEVGKFLCLESRSLDPLSPLGKKGKIKKITLVARTEILQMQCITQQ